MEERILKPSSTNCCRSPGQMSLFDSLDGGRMPQTTERLPIASSMLNTGESPSAAEESTLSQILMENPPETLFLSEKALHGILNRASRRGKPLPPLLLTAINGVLAWMAAGKTTPSKFGRDVAGGGKGALVQADKSATLATHQDQTVFQRRVYGRPKR